MSFLAPLFLIGAIAVGLPILFHLIRRTSKENIPFSSLMFLQPSPPRVTRRSRLEHIFLLLLRCLVICLLALGFARPFIQQPVTAEPAPEQIRRFVLLLDTSASMRREGLWSAATAKATDILKGLSPGDQVAVFTFDSRLRPLVSFEQWAGMNSSDRAAQVESQIAAMKPGWFSTHLGNALTAAAEVFAEGDKKGQNLGLRRIVLISDLQEGSRLDGLQGYEWPRGVEVQVETVAARRPTNAGLQWVAESSDAAASETNVAVRIRVSNSSNAKNEQFQLHWDGVAGATPLDVYVPPGQNRIVPAPILPTNATADKLVLTGDDDDFDNTANIIQPRAEEINVLFLGDEPDEAAQPLFYLKRAFQQTRRQAIKVNPRPAGMTIAATETAGTRLLVATDRLPDSQAPALRNFVENGGTVLFVMKNAAAAASIGQLVDAGALTSEEITATNYIMLGSIDFEHPLFAPFSDPRYNDFTRIHIWKYRRLDAAKIPGSRVIVKYEGGDPALFEVAKGKGRVLVLTTGWQPADSQLALSSKFVPLLYAILDLAGGIKAIPTQFHVGDEVNLANLITVNPTQPITVQKPDGAQVSLPAGETRFAQFDAPGFYTVTSAQPPLRLAVNLDAAESRTGALLADDLEKLGLPVKPREVNVTMQAGQKKRLHDTELEARQKLWRWLTFAALVVLLGETWVAGSLTRRATALIEAKT
jgi:hypothetical protein